jgi:hypothetical protein
VCEPDAYTASGAVPLATAVATQEDPLLVTVATAAKRLAQVSEGHAIVIPAVLLHVIVNVCVPEAMRALAGDADMDAKVAPDAGIATRTRIDKSQSFNRHPSLQKCSA